MNLTVTTLAKSLAGYLAPHFPGVAFYEDPNQQGSTAPCMFLQTLDLLMETFPYSDGETEGTVLLRTHEREWRIDLDALHYRFELMERVSIPQAEIKMETMDYNGSASIAAPCK